MAYLQLFSDWLIYVFYFTCKEYDFQLVQTYVIKIFFQIILTPEQDACYDLKSLAYATVFYVKNIKMCIHLEGVRILTLFLNISYKTTL